MCEANRSTIEFPALSSQDVLTDILRAGAQRMLATAIDAEVAEWINSHQHLTDEQGHRQVVRNGYHSKRKITTGLGQLEIEQPRVHDRRPEGQREKFISKILPPYLRKTKSIEELLPWLYLKGISTGDMNEALQSLLGPECPGLSASTVTNLKKSWEAEFKEWKRIQPGAKDLIHQIWMADTRSHANEAFDQFLETYGAKYPQATECLEKDREQLLAFYDFPAEHWKHLRTTNPIESTFATVRLRTKKTKGSGSRAACLTMVFKLMMSAQKKWRLLNGSSLLSDVIQGIKFIDGVKVTKQAA